jgi:hypothetical protein
MRIFFVIAIFSGIVSAVCTEKLRVMGKKMFENN